MRDPTRPSAPSRWLWETSNTTFPVSDVELLKILAKHFARQILLPANDAYNVGKYQSEKDNEGFIMSLNHLEYECGREGERGEEGRRRMHKRNMG